MKSVKVLIADDSVVYRSQIRAALSELAGVDGVGKLEVVGSHSNGKLALDYLDRAPVDLLILDLEMPEMDGIQLLKELREKKHACKVLVFSSASRRGAEIAMEALRLGASDFVTKPGSPEGGSALVGDVQPSQKIKELLEPKLKALFSKLGHDPSRAKNPSAGNYPRISWDNVKPKIVVIGSSTGGPTVLERIFSELTPPFHCPIVIVQHMPPIFTATLADRLSRICGVPASEVRDGMILQPNHVYVAPGDYHLTLTGTPEVTKAVLDQGPQIHSVRPAVDPLFVSAAEIFGDRCLGFVLTGMGGDGKVGAQRIKEKGGAVVIQSEATCVVFGMPGAVFAAGAYDRIASPAEIVEILKNKIGRSDQASIQRAASGG